MLGGMSAIWLVYGGAALAGIMVAEAVFLLYSGNRDKRQAINRRMKLHEKKLTQEQVLVQLRKERGVDGGRSMFSLQGLRELRTHSGLTMPLPRFLMLTTGIVYAIAFASMTLGVSFLISMAIAAVLCPALPVMVLRSMRKRRQKRFGIQLPEALELITRSLKAGHPVPVAIAMVAREMPDPIGTEFGLVADEVTYGSDLVSALGAMYERVGHEDLPLFVTAVSIQSTTGGNLREILDGLSRVIRERGKLRRKVRAISTEGRISAYILSAVPVLLGVGLMVLMPQFYGGVWDKPLTWYLLGGAVAWLLLGNAAMFKMANFRF
ncbi:MAG: type II secretion system F family protein [Rhizobiaceae bacterium]